MLISLRMDELALTRGIVAPVAADRVVSGPGSLQRPEKIFRVRGCRMRRLTRMAASISSAQCEAVNARAISFNQLIRRHDMFKQKLAGVVVAAGLLLGAGAVNAAQSAIPAATNETASSPHQYQGNARIDGAAGITRSGIPASQNETAASPHAYQRNVKPVTPNTGSVFPVAYGEVA
jgi:hypothetical protein